jgi:hypothetical protein
MQTAIAMVGIAMTVVERMTAMIAAARTTATIVAGPLAWNAADAMGTTVLAIASPRSTTTVRIAAEPAPTRATPNRS